MTKDRYKERHEQLIKEAATTYAHHELVHESPTMWRLARRHEDGKLTSIYFTEIVSLWGGEIYVGGDVDYVIFGRYSDKRDHLSKLRWIGQCTDIDYYVYQKARVGSGDAIVTTWSQSIAEEEVLELLGDQREYYADDDDTRKLAALVEDWEESGWPDYQEDLHAALWAHVPDLMTDRDRGFGEVIAPRVYYAHAALRRLCDLLEQRRTAWLCGRCATLRWPNGYEEKMVGILPSSAELPTCADCGSTRDRTDDMHLVPGVG